MVYDDLTFGRKVAMSRQQSKYTIHEFAQMMNMKLRDLEKIEGDLLMPEKKTITKMNRFLINKLPYSK
jgi:ribosome-binding protein aMBF1 (putative translation factor)